MAKKPPGFMFYPGDYLRDTQNLSEKTQVAYDRIMCEHMRNICDDMSRITVSKKQVKFFMKKLSDEEKEELFIMLTEINDGLQIEWVAESIVNYIVYCNSRKKNRLSNTKKNKKTYVKHMEDESESESEDKKEDKKEKFNFKKSLLDLGIENQIISDWLKVRSKKGASNTITAFNKIKSQIEKSNLSANECIKIAVEKDWKGFEYEWLKTKNESIIYPGNIHKKRNKNENYLITGAEKIGKKI